MNEHPLHKKDFSLSLHTKLLLAVLCLIGVVAIGTAGFYFLGLELREALFMSVTTIALLGARDVDKLGAAGEIWTIILLVIGFTVASISFSYLLATITSGELRKILGRRQLESKIKSLKNHFIVCGYGRMGMMVCENLLEENVPFVVVEKDVNKTNLLEQREIPYILGDATEEETLIEAGIGRAKGLLAVLGDDATNIYVVLTARGLSNNIMIVARHEAPGTEQKLLRAGANKVISPHKICAYRITNLLLHPTIVEFVEITSRDVELELDEIVVREEMPFAGKSLRESELRKQYGIMVVAIKRKDGSTVFSPTAEEIILPGDVLITIGKKGSLANFPQHTQHKE